MIFSKQAAYFGLAFRHLTFGNFLEPESDDPEELGHATIYFPVTGFIFGVGFMFSYFLILHVVGPQLSCLLVMGLMICVFNGGLYKRCVQFVEALRWKSFLERDIVQILWIFTLFMLKFLALTHLGKGWVLGMLILMPTLSCWSLVYLTHSLPSNLFSAGNGLVYARFVKRREFWGATLFTIIVAGACMGLEGLFLLMFMSIWNAIFERWFFFKKIYPLKPALGTAMECNEIFVLLAAIVLRKGFSLSSMTGVWI